MAIMRVTCELAGELRFNMAVMRRTALLEQRAARIVAARCCTGCFLPESPVCSMFPLWKIAGPHTGKLKPGPSRGPVFYLVRAGFAGVMRAEARDSVGEIDDLR